MENTSQIINAFDCIGAYAVVIMSGLKRAETALFVGYGELGERIGS